VIFCPFDGYRPAGQFDTEGAATPVL